MIRFIKGDILSSTSEALVNPVNCVGVMGAGLAKSFKDKYNDITDYFMSNYIFSCKSGYLKPGKILVHFLHSTPVHYIINFPTKDHFNDPSKLSYISDGLDSLSSIIDSYNIKSISIPKLGCGLGGLKWNDVKSLIVSFSERHPNVNILIYE